MGHGARRDSWIYRIRKPCLLEYQLQPISLRLVWSLSLFTLCINVGGILERCIFELLVSKVLLACCLRWNLSRET